MPDIQRYFDLFTDAESVFSNFDATEDQKAGVEILFAEYNYEDYSGSAMVVFRKDGTLFEVHGSHCSCYGLEGQWEPEETSVEALEKGKYFTGISEPHWLSVLAELRNG